MLRHTTHCFSPTTWVILPQDPRTIEHQEGPSGATYALPQKNEKGKKKGKKGKEEEAQQELTEEEKAALYSVPDRQGQKAKSEGVSVHYSMYN